MWSCSVLVNATKHGTVNSNTVLTRLCSSPPCAIHAFLLFLSCWPAWLQSLGIAPTVIGTMTSAFSIAYGSFRVPAAAVADKYGPRLTLTMALLVCGGFTMLTACVFEPRAFYLLWFLHGSVCVRVCVCACMGVCMGVCVHGYAWMSARSRLSLTHVSLSLSLSHVSLSLSAWVSPRPIANFSTVLLHCTACAKQAAGPPVPASSRTCLLTTNGAILQHPWHASLSLILCTHARMLTSSRVLRLLLGCPPPTTSPAHCGGPLCRHPKTLGPRSHRSLSRISSTQ